MRRLAILLLGLALAACGRDPAGPTPPEELTFAPELGVILSEMTRTSTGLYYQDVAVGDSMVAAGGDSITVHYTGWLHNGQQFDTSRGGDPITFAIGVGSLIAGWEEGIPGMKLGGKRKLVVPSQLAYGSQGRWDYYYGRWIIPPDATLVFEVELLGVRKPEAEAE